MRCNKNQQSHRSFQPYEGALVSLYLSESSLFGLFQSEDPSTLQQGAERQALGLSDGRHLPCGAHSAVDLVELKHQQTAVRRPPDDVIVIEPLAANSPSPGRLPCSSPAWSAAAGSRPAASAAAGNSLLRRLRPRCSATPSGRRTPPTAPGPPAAGWPASLCEERRWGDVRGEATRRERGGQRVIGGDAHRSLPPSARENASSRRTPPPPLLAWTEKNKGSTCRATQETSGRKKKLYNSGVFN